MQQNKTQRRLGCCKSNMYMEKALYLFWSLQQSSLQPQNIVLEEAYWDWPTVIHLNTPHTITERVRHKGA